MKQKLTLFKSNRLKILVISTGLNLANFLVYFLAKDQIIKIDICTLIRTLYLFVILETLFIPFKKVFNYLVDFYEVFLFFFLNWLFMAALIEVLFVAFPTYFDNEIHYTFNFNNYFKTLFSVFVFFTGNNSPEMFMKRFPENGKLTYAFMFLIWLNNLLVIGFLIGLSYYKMKISMTNRIREVYANEHKKKVFEKFLEHPEANRRLIKKVLKLSI